MKNLTKIGIIAFIFAIVIVYMSSLNFQNSLTGSAIQQAIVGPQNTTTVLLTLPNSTAVGLAYYTNGNTVNFAFTNQSGLAPVLSEINSSSLWSSPVPGYSYVLEISYNSTYGVFPYQMQNGTAMLHYYPHSPILAAGNYYAVFHNPGQSSVTVSYSTVLKSESQINSTIMSNAAYGIVAMLLFFGGIIIILYSVFAKKESSDSVQVASATSETANRPTATSQRKRRGQKSR